MSVNVAVVGCGDWGPNLIRNFREVQGSALVACCDLDPERLTRIESRFGGVRVTQFYDDILRDGDIDAVAIATPVKSHYALAMQALLSDKHVMVEKPLALSSSESEDLIELAAQRHMVLMVGHTYLYHPAVQVMKQLAVPESLGDLFYIHSQRLNLGRVQNDVNVLWSTASHDISIANYLLGDLPVEVSALGASYLSQKVEDVVFITMRYPNGVVAHCHASLVNLSKVREVTVIGSRRMIVFDDLADEGKIQVCEGGHSKGAGRAGAGQCPDSRDVSYIPVPDVEPLANECSHFVECILEGKRPLSDGWNGLAVVRVLEAAQRSLESGGEPYPVSASPPTLVGAPTPIRLGRTI